jgi:TonB family protein
MIGRWGAAAALMLSGLQAPALAQTPPAPAPVWQVDWGDYFCTLIRLQSEDIPFATAMRTVPGSFTASLRLVRLGDESLPRRVSSIAVQPSGQSWDVTASSEVLRNGMPVLALSSLPDTFWDALAGATELQLRDGTQVRRSIPLTRPAAAVRGLRRCVSDALREWGVDEAGLRALQRRPETSNAYGLTPGDYPSSALRTGRSGRVLVRIAVNADGRATDCAVAATSDDPALDRTTCDVVLRRARFTPALDASGAATAATVVNVVTWMVQP